MGQSTFIACAAALSLALAGASTHAQVVIPSRAAFIASYPGAPLENFEEARLPVAGFGLMAGPLDQFTNNAIFIPGEIIPGLRLTVPLGPAGEDNMFIANAGFANYVSKTVSYNFPTTPPPEITIDFFGSPAIAFGLDLTANPNGQTLTVQAFNGAVSLGSFPVANVVGSGTFFGLQASGSNVITRVTLTSTTDYFGVDNIAFAIPEPATGLALLGLPLLLRRTRRCAP